MTPAVTESFGVRLRRGERLLGGLLRMPNEGLIELAGMAGLDFVVIDTEHGPGDQLALARHLSAAGTGMRTVVRIGHPSEAMRVLDLGADAVLAPHVSSVADARALIEAVHYPPLGRRGFANYTRAGRYGLTGPADHHAAARAVAVIVMIEDADGLAAAAEIAALDGIDGLMLGPADFAMSLGVVGGVDDPRVIAAVVAVRSAAHAAGIAALSIAGTPAAAKASFRDGDDAVMYNLAQALGDLFTSLVAAGSESGPDNDGFSVGPGLSPLLTRQENLLLVPGMLADQTVWDATASELIDAAAPQFARIDLDESIAELATSILAVAPARFALVGHSLGAIVALEIVRRAPQRVTRLALINATARAPAQEQQAAWATTIARLEAGEFSAVAAELARRTLPPGRRDDAALVAANERMAFTVAADGLRRQLRAQQGRTSYLDELAAIAVPVLIVSGALDDVCPPERQREILAHCPRAHLVSLDGAGHMVPLEQPAELAVLLRSWLLA
jgi:4-hydroxy-2-oxoheptanedioate aldolase